MEILAALIGDAARGLPAETGALAADDEGSLLGHGGGDLDLFQEAHGGGVVALAAIQVGRLSQGFVHRLDRLVLEEARRLYFLLAVT